METRKTNDAHVGWRFWIAWVVGTTLGWVLSFILTFMIVGMVIEAIWGNPDPEAVGLPFAPFLILIFVIAGSGMGIAQWLLLRKHLERAIWWIPATGLAFATVAILYFVLEGLVSETAGVVIHNAASGVVAGTLQWLILRRNVDRAGWWVLTSIMVFLVSGVLSDLYLQAVVGLDGAESTIVAVVVMATISGAVMVYLLRQSSPEAEMVAATA